MSLMLLKSSVGEYDVHCEPKSYKFKLLRKLFFQYAIRASFDGRSSIRALPLHVYFQFIKPTCEPKIGGYM